ncbi:MAG: hypothetical protein M1830_006982 [Pleopsidium flavum]|nr:MAG: hypothetical protein M1830_006982 [Pleopsidium flavum]
MTTQLQHVRLAKSLPKQLTRFFARYPPPALLSPSSSVPNPVTSPSDTITLAPNTSSSDPNATIEADNTLPPSSVGTTNPFQSQRHPATGNWHDPVFSLRRQADLVKLARKHGVEDLLPYTVKGTQERLSRREDNGLRVKGTGVGQKVKGKAWERTMKGRLERRRQAMLEMPKMIQTWKEVSSLYIIDPFIAQLTYVLQSAGPWSWMEEISEVVQRSWIQDFWI